MPALEIPSLVGFNSKVFDIGHYQSMNPTGNTGFIQTLNRSSPTWFAEYGTPGLIGERYNETRSFLDLLEGSMNPFLGFDPRRPMPYAYRTLSTSATPWGTAPKITAQDYANSLITIADTTVGAVITKGDYISVQVNNIWYLFRVQENWVSLGTPFSIVVKPRPNIAGLVGNEPIRYRKACIEMKMIGGVEESDSVDDLPAFRFRAAQFTRRADI